MSSATSPSNLSWPARSSAWAMIFAACQKEDRIHMLFGHQDACRAALTLSAYRHSLFAHAATQSASSTPCSISRAAWHSNESLTTLRAQRSNVLVLKTLFMRLNCTQLLQTVLWTVLANIVAASRYRCLAPDPTEIYLHLLIRCEDAKNYVTNYSSLPQKACSVCPTLHFSFFIRRYRHENAI